MATVGHGRSGWGAADRLATGAMARRSVGKANDAMARSSAKGRRRAPKRRRRRSSPMRGLIAVASAFAVVGTGVAIGWGSHVFQGRHGAPDGQNLAAPTSVVTDAAAAPGAGSGTA